MNTKIRNRSRLCATAVGVAAIVVATAQAQGQQAPQTGLPKYPETLQATGVEGNVVAHIAINADGLPLEGSLKILSSSHQLFTNAVRDAFPQLRFAPAAAEGRAARQLIQHIFEFRMPAADAKSPEPASRQTAAAPAEQQLLRGGTTRITATKPPPP